MCNGYHVSKYLAVSAPVFNRKGYCHLYPYYHTSFLKVILQQQQLDNVLENCGKGYLQITSILYFCLALEESKERVDFTMR